VTSRRAEIAGAGLAGLSLGIRLAQLGWDVQIHERGPELRMFGAGIWLWENGLRSLRIIGAEDATIRRAREIQRWEIRDERDRLMMRRPTTADDRLLLPPRADLYAALLDRADDLGVKIETNSTAVGLNPNGALIMEGGHVRPADLVVAADGAYSRLRESLLCTRTFSYGFETGIRMLIDRVPSDPHDVVTEHVNDKWRLLFNPCTDGEDYIFLSAPVDDEEGRGLPVDRAVWTRRFPALAPVIDRFAEAGRWDRIVTVRCHHWTAGRAVVVGDAAHAMPPNLGQAANMAFINMMSLAAAVDQAPDVPAALAAWEREARPLTDHVQRWSSVYGYVAGKWPQPLAGWRTPAVRALSATPWFERGLNRGARAVPVPYTTTETPRSVGVQ
jgi:2-polyprenyl-6-methoxyphenol hydroxylase-like FAD-dependent oxidoreductase